MARRFPKRKVLTDGREAVLVGWLFNCNRHASNLLYDQRKRAEAAFEAHRAALSCAHGVVLPEYRAR